jgi:hypothetical protein
MSLLSQALVSLNESSCITAKQFSIKRGVSTFPVSNFQFPASISKEATSKVEARPPSTLLLEAGLCYGLKPH